MKGITVPVSIAHDVTMHTSVTLGISRMSAVTRNRLIQVYEAMQCGFGWGSKPREIVNLLEPVLPVERAESFGVPVWFWVSQSKEFKEQVDSSLYLLDFHLTPWGNKNSAALQISPLLNRAYDDKAYMQVRVYVEAAITPLVNEWRKNSLTPEQKRIRAELLAALKNKQDYTVHFPAI